MASDSIVDQRENGAPPRPFQMAGHGWAVDLLRRAADPVRGGPHHAYLFLGAPQVGKRTLARSFAAALLCTEDGARPCGECRSCRLMARDAHPDFFWVQPLDRTGEPDRRDGLLRVEQAAEIIHTAVLRPLEGRYRCFLIQDVQLANDSFANKLLKTLEEPPEHTVLCLTALERGQLLPTLVSRCQVLDLRPVGEETIARFLSRSWSVPQAEAELLARMSGGRPGWAVEQWQTGEALEKRREMLEQLRHLTTDGPAGRLAFSQGLAASKDRGLLLGLLALWTGWWRDVMLAQAGCIDACNNIDLRDLILADAGRFDPAAVLAFLRTLDRIEGYLHHTVNLGLTLDVLLLQLPGPTRRQG